VQDDTIAWWATQPPEAQEEAFGEEGRIPLEQALQELGKLNWHSKRFWANGPTFDANILVGWVVPLTRCRWRCARSGVPRWPCAGL
jgi:hypothetical protein